MKESIRRFTKQQLLGSRSPWIHGIGAFTLASLVSRWMSTLDYRTYYHDMTVDPALYPAGERRFIYVFWHEYIPYQFYLRGHCDICMLLSQNRDAEWLARACRMMGFELVRGSTYHGGANALRQLIRISRQKHLTITPDGPRGPRRQLSIGPVYLASRLRIPIVAVGMGYDRPWRLNSWDRFAVPRPFSRARCVISEPLSVPSTAERGQLEIHRAAVESTLNRLTMQAESWAASGKRLDGETVTHRAAACPSARRGKVRVQVPRTGSAGRPKRLRIATINANAYVDSGERDERKGSRQDGTVRGCPKTVASELAAIDEYRCSRAADGYGVEPADSRHTA
ncbi:MAG: lysophospholipid acyltransferase family protein [Pirellulaceae bacterium]